jgi:hypothetical protein
VGRERSKFCIDACSPEGRASTAAARSFYNQVQRLKLDVSQIVPIHSKPVAWRNSSKPWAASWPGLHSESSGPDCRSGWRERLSGCTGVLYQMSIARCGLSPIAVVKVAALGSHFADCPTVRDQKGPNGCRHVVRTPYPQVVKIDAIHLAKCRNVRDSDSQDCDRLGR